MLTHDPHRNQPVVRVGPLWQEAEGAIILLHGRGASADDILGLRYEIGHPTMIYLAPEAAESVWYPNSFISPLQQNQPYLSSALARIKSLVDEVLANGVPVEKIVLAGFSQGACLATEFVARNPARYGGMIAFTGGLIGPAEVTDNIGDYVGDLREMPAFFGTSDPDPHIPWERVDASAKILTAMGASVTVKRYEGMPHTINREEIEFAKQIVASVAKG